MKHLKLAVIALFTLVTVSNVNAQDENNPWVVGFGINIVDVRIPITFGETLNDYIGSTDWNTLPSISRVSAEKYLEKGFTLQLAGSLNKITTVSSIDDSDFIYYAFDANVKYDLNNLFGETSWFDPYVYLGGGLTSMDSEKEIMMNAGIGFNLWVNDNLGFNFQSGAKRNFAGKVQDHFQHTFGVVIKFGGKDTDGDGVYDKDDACPEVAGLKEFKGCPDADGDGVKDSDDACPNTAGLVALNGCPDADGDGVADKNDMCPNSKGTKANKGCPDTDGDGVVDKNDNCATVAGPAANSGCPWPDTDGDGVLDKDDNCKTEVGPASNNGCPEPVIKDEATKTITMAAKKILFNSGKSSFKSGVTRQLDGIIAIMKEFPKANFAIGGHTDSTGKASTNMRISSKRANAVMNYFVKNGIDASRLTAKGYGKDYPIDSNKTRAGRANNRRVEIKVSN